MIVSCGEALIDFLPRLGADGAAVFRPFAGGSPFNVAIAVGRLGSPAGFIGGLSTDFFGETLRDALKASNVDLGLANMSDRPTTLAFVRIENGDARYAFFDEGSAGRRTALALERANDRLACRRNAGLRVRGRTEGGWPNDEHPARVARPKRVRMGRRRSDEPYPLRGLIPILE